MKKTSNRPSLSEAKQLMHPKGATSLKVDFERDNKNYSALFGVTREPNGTTYHLSAQVMNEDGDVIFGKERTGLDYSQVEHALTFVFHQAFVEA